MRISKTDIEQIKKIIAKKMNGNYSVRLFGSRLDDTKKGGDVDLLIESRYPIERPALLSAEIAVQIERYFEGRKTDILLLAPNLKKMPVHEVALQEGVIL